jgi:hypothetical protein
MPEVRSGGVRISYEAVGEGRPLVLLHGWCCDRSWWTEPGYIDDLRSDHRLVNVDIRGHGASDKPHEAAAYSSDAVIGISWIAKISLSPTTVASLTELQERTAVGPIPGSSVLLAFALFFAGLFLFAFATAGMQESAGEVLPRYTPPSVFKRGGKPWFRPSHHREQLLTFIVTLVPEKVSQGLLKDMNRGATILSGTGAYSHEQRGVLMCALTATEVPHLRAVVAAEDPDAFVIVSPAQGVYGRGFNPLKAEA